MGVENQPLMALEQWAFLAHIHILGSSLTDDFVMGKCLYGSVFLDL